MRDSSWFEPLHAAAPVILPSLLQCDFTSLRDEIVRLEQAGIRALHLDVMDGQFVPNLTYGMPIVAAMRRCTELPLDVHLMIARPERYIGAFREAGADNITVHAEAVDDLGGVLEEIRGLGATAGIAINPDTPLDAVKPFLAQCNVLLIMSVEAGFGGQAFRSEALEKLRDAKQLVGPQCVLQVDGGVNDCTIAQCAAAGADWFVVGSAIFKQPDYAAAIADLRRCIGET